MTRHVPLALTSRGVHPSSFRRALAENPDPGTDAATAAGAVERLSGLSDQLRQSFTDALWQSIPATVQEFGRNDGFGAGSPVLVGAEFGELVRITRVVASVPAGCTATITLGDHTFPNLNGGVTSFAVERILTASDVRSLTCTTGPGGSATLALYGTQLAPTGSMAP